MLAPQSRDRMQFEEHILGCRKSAHHRPGEPSESKWIVVTTSYQQEIRVDSLMETSMGPAHRRKSDMLHGNS